MIHLPKIILLLIAVSIVGWFVFLLSSVNIQILNPKGIISGEQSKLIITSFAIMLPIAITVVIIGLITAWRFRESNENPKRDLTHSGSKLTLFIYWAFLAELVLIFFFIVFVNSHKLDPYKPIDSEKDPMTVQVVALQWKWLFIYPEQNIASVNHLQIPVDTPVNFRLTSDGPMNSFWIPSLGGQIYSMSGMETQINLMADEKGQYKGEAAEINGEGFAGMRFKTLATSQKEFEEWVEDVQDSYNILSQEEYDNLSTPSENAPVKFYSGTPENLFENIMMKYMTPGAVVHGKENGH